MTAAPPEGLNRLKEARELTARLLDLIGIDRVILVDDQAGPTEGPVRAALQAGKKIEMLGAGPPPADASVAEVSDWLREHWDELNLPQRRAAYGEAVRALVDEPGHETANAELSAFEVLAYVMADRLTMVTPDEWGDEEAELIGCSPDEAVLVLFDLVLGTALDGGMSLLVELRERRPDVRCAIITSATDPAGELSMQVRLAEEHEIASDMLLLSSKEHLTPQGCMRFVDLLRVTANSRRLHALRDHVADAAETYGRQARKRLAAFDDRVLEDIVFRSSHIEGAWEVDSLLRVLSILQRDESRKGEIKDAQSHQLLDLARELVNLHYEPHRLSGSQAAELMALENYDPGETLNPLGLPLANGDIFESGSQHLLLLEQPCYLQVRPNGHRSRETPYLTLLELGAGSSDDAEGSGGRPGWELPSGHEFGANMQVFFTPRHPIAVEILDLCTMNGDGYAQYGAESPSTTAPLTVGLRQLHKRRVNHFTGLASNLTETLDAVKDRLSKQLRKKIVASILDGRRPAHASWDPDGPAITYECRRVARLSPNYADAALTAFHVYEARAAHDHDLGRFR